MTRARETLVCLESTPYYAKKCELLQKNYLSVLGAIDRIKAFAQVQKKSWHRGQRAVLNYRHCGCP
jgi:hypothetical protein